MISFFLLYKPTKLPSYTAYCCGNRRRYTRYTVTTRQLGRNRLHRIPMNQARKRKIMMPQANNVLLADDGGNRHPYRVIVCTTIIWGENFQTITNITWRIIREGLIERSKLEVCITMGMPNPLSFANPIDLIPASWLESSRASVIGGQENA